MESERLQVKWETKQGRYVIVAAGAANWTKKDGGPFIGWEGENTISVDYSYMSSGKWQIVATGFMVDCRLMRWERVGTGQDAFAKATEDAVHDLDHSWNWTKPVQGPVVRLGVKAKRNPAEHTLKVLRNACKAMTVAMFADRPTYNEAMRYANDLIETIPSQGGGQLAAYTALYVANNTIAKVFLAEIDREVEQ